MGFNKCLGALALLTALAVSPARAGIISGHLDFDLNTLQWEVDEYLIAIQSPATFSARTLDGPANVADPALFLFRNSSLRGVYMNDDTTNVDLQSTLPAAHPLGPLLPGLYRLAIGWGFTDPQSATGPIFPVYELSLDTAGVYGPTGSGGADPLIGFNPGGPPNFDVPADYVIELVGALLVPEPGTLALLALGFVIAARVRRTA